MSVLFALGHKHQFSRCSRAVEQLVRVTCIGQRQALGHNRVDLALTKHHRIREASAPLVEGDDAPKGREPRIEMHDRRFLPLDVEVRDEAGRDNEVGALSGHRERDIQAATLGIVDGWRPATCGYAEGVDAVNTLTREALVGRHREHPKRNDTRVEDFSC
jgi:hypothetical protein